MKCCLYIVTAINWRQIALRTCNMLQACHWLRTHFGPSPSTTTAFAYQNGHQGGSQQQQQPQQQQQHHRQRQHTKSRRLSMIQSSAERADGRTCGAEQANSDLRFRKTPANQSWESVKNCWHPERALTKKYNKKYIFSKCDPVRDLCSVLMASGRPAGPREIN